MYILLKLFLFRKAFIIVMLVIFCTLHVELPLFMLLANYLKSSLIIFLLWMIFD